MVATAIPRLALLIVINMKYAILLIAACALPLIAVAKGAPRIGKVIGTGSNSSSHLVRGHMTRNGTYVAPSHATNPNSTKSDNYTATGNLNPFTGGN